MGLSDSDTDLVLKSRTGNSQAFNELIERYGSKLLHSAHYLTDDWDEAMDVVQDALVYAYHSLGRLRDPDRFLPWVQTIVLRTYQGYIRQKKRRKKLLDYYKKKDVLVEIDGTKSIEDVSNDIFKKLDDLK